MQIKCWLKFREMLFLFLTDLSEQENVPQAMTKDYFGIN